MRPRVFSIENLKSARKWTSVILVGKQDVVRNFTTSFCEKGVVAKANSRNVDGLVFFESLKGLAIIIQNNCVKFFAHREYNEAS